MFIIKQKLRHFILLVSMVCLSAGLSANEPRADDSQTRLLLEAALNGDLQKAEEAIKNGADVNGRSEERIKSLKFEDSDYPEGSTPLHIASGEGHLEFVKFLIKNKANVNAKIETSSFSQGKTALMNASEHGHLEIIKHLTDAKADINLKMDNGTTALIYASQKGHLEVVKYLISNKVNVNEVDSIGNSSLIHAMNEGKGNIEIARILIENHADVNVRGADGKTALMNALFYPEILKLLIEKKADVNARVQHKNKYNNYHYDYTALLLALNYGKEDAAKLLIENGAKIEDKTEEGYTTLMAASSEGCLDIVKMIINEGPNVNAQVEKGYSKGKTALMYASAKGHSEIAKLLIENKADVNAKDENGKTALMFASEKNHLKIIKFLIKNKASINDIEKSDSSTVLSYGYSALMYAAKEGHIQVVKFLIENGADVNAKVERDYLKGYTPLMLASKLEIVQLLINAKADINSKSENGMTPLMDASQSGYLEIAKLLLKRGANVNDLTNESKTALMFAAQSGHLDLIKLLINHKAVITSYTDHYDSALSHSLNSNHYILFNYLLPLHDFSFKSKKLIDKEIFHFFKLMNTIFPLEPKDRIKLLQSIADAIEKKNYQSELHSTLLWFIYKQIDSQKADKLFSKTSPKFPESIVYKLKESHPLNEEFYYLLGKFYSLHKDFDQSDKYVKLLYDSKESVIDRIKLDNNYKYYYKMSFHLKRGLPYILQQDVNRPKTLIQNGHNDWIRHFVFSPDGKILATGSDDKTVKLWRVEDGKLLYNLEGHTLPLFKLFFSPDGKTLITSAGTIANHLTGEVKAWSVKEGKLLYDLPKDSLVWDVSFTRTGNKFAVTSGDTAQIRNTEDGTLIKKLNFQDYVVDSVAFSPDEETLATASWMTSVKIWRVKDGKLLLNIDDICSINNQLSFSKDGKTIILTNLSSLTQLIRVKDGKILQTFKGENPVLSFDKSLIATVSKDITKVWRLEEGKLITSFAGEKPSFSPDGKKIITFTSNYQDKMASVWNIETGKWIYSLKDAESGIFSSDGKTIATYLDKSVKFWNADIGTLNTVLQGQSDRVVQSSNNYIATLSDDKNIRILSKNDFRLLQEIKHPGKNPMHIDFLSASFSKDEKSIAISYLDSQVKGGVKIWNWEDGKLLNSFEETAVYYHTFAPDGKGIMTVNYDFYKSQGKTQFRNLSDGKILYTLDTPTFFYNKVSFSTEGGIFAVNYNHEIELRIISDGKLIRKLQGEFIRSISFSPDSKFIAAGTSTGTIYIWKAEDGKLLYNFKGLYSEISEILFSSDGKYIIAGAKDNTISVWEIHTGKRIQKLKSHSGTITSLSFENNSKILVSASDDNTIKYWDFDSIVKTHGGSSPQKTNRSQYLLATQIFFNDNSSLIYTPDGRFDYTDKSALNYVSYRAPTIQSGFIDLQDVYNQYYTPGLMKDILEGNFGTVYNENSFAKAVETVPDLKVLNLDSQRKLSADTEQIELMFQARDKGGGIDHVEVFVNGMQVRNVSREGHAEESVYDNDAKSTGKSKSGKNKSASGKTGSDGILNNDKNIKTHQFSADLNVDLKSRLKKGSKLKAVIQENRDGIQSMNVYIDGQKKPIVFRSSENGKKGNIEEGTARNLEFTETRKGPPVNFTAEIPIAPGLNRIEIKAFNKANVPQNYPAIEVLRELPSGADTVKPRLYILSVGVNNYAKNKLTYSVNDAKAVAETIRSNADNLYSEVKTVLLSDSEATREKIIESLKSIENNAKPEDVIVLYFSGHGMNAVRANGRPLFYFVPQDFPWPDNADSENIAVRYGIDGEFLDKSMGRMKSHKVILILDACHSGAVQYAMAKGDEKTEETKRQMERMANGTGRFIFASSSGSELSREHKDVGHGLYTYVLLNAMGYNKSKNIPDAEIKPDGDLYLWELESYIKANFEDQTKVFLNGIIQTPPVMSLGRNEMNARVNDFPFLKAGKRK